MKILTTVHTYGYTLPNENLTWFFHSILPQREGEGENLAGRENVKASLYNFYKIFRICEGPQNVLNVLQAF